MERLKENTLGERLGQWVVYHFLLSLLPLLTRISFEIFWGDMLSLGFNEIIMKVILNPELVISGVLIFILAINDIVNSTEVPRLKKYLSGPLIIILIFVLGLYWRELNPQPLSQNLKQVFFVFNITWIILSVGGCFGIQCRIAYRKKKIATQAPATREKVEKPSMGLRVPKWILFMLILAIIPASSSLSFLIDKNLFGPSEIQYMEKMLFKTKGDLDLNIPIAMKYLDPPQNPIFTRHIRLGLEALDNKEYRKAIRSFQSAILLDQSPDYRLGLSDLIAATQIKAGYYDEAKGSVEEMLSLAQNKNDTLAEYEAYFKYGVVALGLKNAPDAISSFKKAVSIARLIPDQALEAKSLENQGNAYFYLDSLREAKNYFKKALTIYENINDIEGQVRVQIMLKPLERGIRIPTPSIPPDRGKKMNVSTTTSRTIIPEPLPPQIGARYCADAYELLGAGKPKQARDTFLLAWSIYLYWDDLKGLREVDSGIALCYFALGEFEQCSQYFNQVILKEYEKKGYTEEIIRVKNTILKKAELGVQADLFFSLGLDLFRTGRQDEARQRFYAARAKYDALGFKGGVGKCDEQLNLIQ